MKLRFNLFLVLIWSVLTLEPALLFAQGGLEEDQYTLLLDEVHALHADSQTDSALLDSARSYAQKGQMIMATVFLEQILDTHLTVADQKVTSLPDYKNDFSFTIKSGLDFNRQEFEVGYIQTDSVIFDELQKPFLGIELVKALSYSPQNTFQFLLNSRYDKENFIAEGKIIQSHKGSALNSIYEAGLSYDRNYLYPEFTAFEGYGRQRMNWMWSGKYTLQIDNNVRYKKYKQPSQDIPSFIRDRFAAGLGYGTLLANSWQLEYTMDLNESLHSINNDYLDQMMNVSWNSRTAGLTAWSAELAAGFNRFSYVIGDSVYKNRAKVIQAQIHSNTHISSKLSLKMEYNGRLKSYIKKSEQDPDYWLNRFTSTFQRQCCTHFAFDAGYQFEMKNHFTFKGAEEAYILDQNYFGNGFLLGIEYSNIYSYLISFSAGYSWRRYPDATGDKAFSLYSNRNILTFSLIGQIPLTKRTVVNIFASYDNDQDLDREESNTRNSFFSADLEYRF